jgi:hypothetical protein
VFGKEGNGGKEPALERFGIRGCVVRKLWLVVLCLVVAAPLALGAPARYRIVVKADPPEGGVVAGGGVYAEGAVVTVTATPRVGFAFVNWTEEDQEVSTAPEYTFTVAASRTLVAHFVPVRFAQIGGRWVGRLQLLPTVVLERSLFDISYTFGHGNQKWNIDSSFLFTDAGFISMTSRFTGALGPFRIGAGLSFDPSVPAYKNATLMVSSYFAEYRLWVDLWVRHYAKWGLAGTPYMTYELYLYSPPIRVNLVFDDDCTGIKFKEVTGKVAGLSLCCGITYDAELSFTKAGFDYVEFEAKNLFPLCCGISFDTTLRFSLHEKSVSIQPKWEDVGSACLKVYGDVLWDENHMTFSGISIYGFKIRCEFGEPCPTRTAIRNPFVEFVTAFTPEKMGWAGFKQGEFEYLKLGLCGPSCCGAGYTLQFSAYFGGTGGLFGFSRILWSASVPLLTNLQVGVSLEVGRSGSTFKVNWAWEF